MVEYHKAETGKLTIVQKRTMNISEFRETIKRREYVEEISSGEWAEGIEECWKREIQLLCEDPASTIEFLTNECTETEFSWISEVLEEVIDQTQSQDNLDSYRALMDKYPEECNRYHIREMLQGMRESLDS